MADNPSAIDPQEQEASASLADPSAFAKLEAAANGASTPPINGTAGEAVPVRLDLVFDVPVCLSVELGRTEIPIRDVVKLGRGSIIELDRGPGTPLDVRVNGVLIGRGEVVLVNSEKLGVRFVEVMGHTVSPKRSG